MNNNEEFVRLWSEIVKKLANSVAHSELRRTSREEDRVNIGRKRPAESRREILMKRVKRQSVSNCPLKSHHNVSEKKNQRELIRSKLETLIQITPNCPKTDIMCVLDSVTEYMNKLQIAVFLIMLRNSI